MDRLIAIDKIDEVKEYLRGKYFTFCSSQYNDLWQIHECMPVELYGCTGGLILLSSEKEFRYVFTFSKENLNFSTWYREEDFKKKYYPLLSNPTPSRVKSVKDSVVKYFGLPDENSDAHIATLKSNSHPQLYKWHKKNIEIEMLASSHSEPNKLEITIVKRIE